MTITVNLALLQDPVTGMPHVLPDMEEIRERRKGIQLDRDLAKVYLESDDPKEVARGEQLNIASDLSTAVLDSLSRQHEELHAEANYESFTLRIPTLKQRVYAHLKCTEIDPETGEKSTADGKLMVELLLSCVEGMSEDEVDGLAPSIQEALWARLSRAMRPDPVRLPFLSSK